MLHKILLPATTPINMAAYWSYPHVVSIPVNKILEAAEMSISDQLFGPWFVGTQICGRS